ncbi:MAG: hypothetical protein IPL59_04265 [Candidatus Competibacteraceae bacterium]|nr:hypothetical protein [Candidatus Competibacteraceae bacterium]
MNPFLAPSPLSVGVSGAAGRRCFRLLLGILLSIAGPVLATPLTPTDPNQVLERLPLAATDPVVRELQGLRRQLVAQPDDLDLALQVARRNIEIGRSEADPRYYGYAQAALAPWWEQTLPRLKCCCCGPCCARTAMISRAP